MGTEDKSRYSRYKPESLEVHYGTPKCGFTTTCFRANQFGFRVNLSVVGPEPEKHKDNVELTAGEFDVITQATANLVEMLIKHTFGEEPPV